ncbi:MAG: hypothetical protein JJU02_12735 [Cryomorphaceae bacterium]|nr:hypothetical protein [Cryomorphaceae bacterium]
MHKFLFPIALFFLCSHSYAQSYSLRGDIGILGSNNPGFNSDFNPQFSISGGLQFHQNLNEKSAISVGMYHLLDVHPYTNYSEIRKNIMAIPVNWHRKLGVNKRFEFSSGLYYAREFGSREILPENEWHFETQGKASRMGINIGIQYAFFKSDKLDISMAYQGFLQLYVFQNQVTWETRYLASLLSLQCTIPIK